MSDNENIYCGLKTRWYKKNRCKKINDARFTGPKISACFHEERGTQVQSLHYLEDSEVIWLHGFKPSGTDNTPVPIV
jgi:hypothetical protein